MTQRKLAEQALTILGQELKPGSIIKAETLEETLGLKRNNQGFMWVVSQIRQALYDRGLYLSGEGFQETGCFEIVPPSENRHILQRAMDRAERDLEGKIRLVANTDTTLFNDYERRNHEQTLRQASIRLDAMRHAKQFEATVARLRKKPVIELESENVVETEKSSQLSQA